MPRQLIISLLLIGQVTFMFAQQHIEVLEEKLDQLPENRARVDALVQLGKYKQAGAARQSILHFEEAMALAQSLQYEEGLFEAHYGLALTYFTSNRIDRAVETLEAVLPQVKASGKSSILERYYLSLAQISGKRGDLGNLRKYQQLYAQLQDSLAQAEANAEIEVFEEKYEAEKDVATVAIQERAQALSALKEQEQISLQRQLEIARLQTQTAELERARAEEESARLTQENSAIQREIDLQRKLQTRNRLIVAVCLLLLVAGVIIQRMRILQQRKQVAFEKQKSERLMQIDRLKDQFLANTSHELKTPLNGIIGIAEGLYDGVHAHDPDQQRANLGMIISSGKRLGNLVNDLLDFSKIRNNELRLDLRPVDIRSIAEIVLHMNKAQAELKRIQMQNRIAEDIPLVEGDEDRLQQILFNLLDNAIKFSKHGTILIDAHVTDNDVEISVTDQGVGIPEDKQDEIFEDFRQLDGGLDRHQSGTGLGLSITRKLVELHRGSIRVDSKPGKGSTFSFSIPVAEEQDQKTRPASSLSRLLSLPDSHSHPSVSTLVDDTSMPQQADRIRILIVDDEPINQQVLRNHLSDTHYEIVTAMDGEDAMDHFQNGEHFDLVLLDIMMPKMTGYSVCQQIRAQYLPSELPIIMITAKNQVTDLVEALSYGANDYLAKPFSKDEFLARIKTHLNLHTINSATTRFVPSEFLRSLGYDAITDVRLGDYQERDVTVFFSDIRSYTTMSEKMTPEENFKFVGAYVSRMGPIIRKYDGFVLQYLGDGIMALFLESPDKAVQAAIAMQRRIQKYNEDRKANNRQPIQVGMGLHTGPLVMGIIGDNNRNDPATISDSVNVASRMEGLTRTFGASILITRATVERLENEAQFSYRYLGQVMVKGKQEMVPVYEVMDGDEPARRSLKEKTKTLFETGVAAYLADDLEEADRCFSAVLVSFPDDHASLYYKELMASQIQAN